MWKILCNGRKWELRWRDLETDASKKTVSVYFYEFYWNDTLSDRKFERVSLYIKIMLPDKLWYITRMSWILRCSTISLFTAWSLTFGGFGFKGGVTRRQLLKLLPSGGNPVLEFRHYWQKIAVFDANHFFRLTRERSGLPALNWLVYWDCYWGQPQLNLNFLPRQCRWVSTLLTMSTIRLKAPCTTFQIEDFSESNRVCVMNAPSRSDTRCVSGVPGAKPRENFEVLCFRNAKKQPSWDFRYFYTTW